MQKTFINPRFDLIRLWIQDHIGQFIVFLLVSVYLMTGFAIGISLQKGLLAAFGLTLSWVAGMGIAVLAQMIRGSLVYFSQANPYRINTNGHLIGGVAAFILTIWASYEVISLLSVIQVNVAVQTSLVGFIVAGFFLEMFFLNELIKINNAILVNDPELFKRAIENEEKLVEITTRVGEAKIKLINARRERFTKALGSGSTEKEEPEEEEQTSPPLKAEKTKSISRMVMEAIAAHILQPEALRDVMKMIDKGIDDHLIVEAIEQLDTKKEEPLSLDISANGNGVFHKAQT